mmetsp:Transcript_37994/g.60189  ORF Transcript_37994/g.60189 Transcript_37994/m.60189 type:complete len:211 (+) Transcript_37994:83-715(+)|eukprot:CAMPEP_0169088672 /NCGR_PEP_ID=MMETSP1015-20121227/14878_1 /TAXON_ID=342587 /ORGANISM="Karlodinium micrum, Strain CCMP2283" /LENGTH=210 /DNA_ID=CAMNT_0009148961 /DNA_START=80 /DNA_END=712 /DNA_ORIENTATION=-
MANALFVSFWILCSFRLHTCTHDGGFCGGFAGGFWVGFTVGGAFFSGAFVAFVALVPFKVGQSGPNGHLRIKALSRDASSVLAMLIKLMLRRDSRPCATTFLCQDCHISPKLPQAPRNAWVDHGLSPNMARASSQDCFGNALLQIFIMALSLRSCNLGKTLKQSPAPKMSKSLCSTACANFLELCSMAHTSPSSAFWHDVLAMLAYDEDR